MAKGMDLVEKSLEELEREITCAICQEHYTDPKVLPCLHYYCKQCILKLALKTGTDKPLSCPECRKKATLPEGSVDQLTTAFVVNRLKDTYTTLERAHGKVEANCELCKASNTNAEAYCRQCVKFICDKCNESHHRMMMFDEHTVISIQQLRDEKEIMPKKLPTRKCLIHDKFLKLYCSDCAHLICKHCAIKDHRDHNFEFCYVTASKTKKELLEELEPLREVSGGLKHNLEEIQTNKHELEAQGNSVANSIKTTFKELHQILEVRQQQLLEEAKTKLKEKIDNLSEQEETISIASAAVLSVLDYTEQSVRHCDDNEVMCMHAEIRRRIEQERKEHSTSAKTMVPKKYVGVEVGCAEALQQLSSTIYSVFHTKLSDVGFGVLPTCIKHNRVLPARIKHNGVFHCCTYCSSVGQKHIKCGCGSNMPGGYSGCGHGHPGHPGGRHWSCCGNKLENSECLKLH